MLRMTQTTQVHNGRKSLQEHSGVYQGCVRRSVLSSFGPAEIQIIKSRANSKKAIPIQNTGNKDGGKDDCDLNLGDSKAVFLHDTLVHDDASPYQVLLQKVIDLDLEDSNPFFCITLCLMMMHHHTKLGCKRLSGSEHIFWTKLRHTDRWKQSWWFQLY